MVVGHGPVLLQAVMPIKDLGIHYQLLMLAQRLYVVWATLEGGEAVVVGLYLTEPIPNSARTSGIE